MEGPEKPRLFLVDGYALIYRAFFAMIARPLTTTKGENTSASWGIANFLQRLITKHQPEYLGWVHDSGLSFRHERYPAYKATREKLTEELQSDFDRGMDRICEMLDAYRIPVITLPGYEADDVIGTLVSQSAKAGVNAVVVSGDKDFQQLVRQYGHLESILEHVPEITKKRPREALLEHASNARLSKELVTIRDDLPVSLDLESLRVKTPDHLRLRDLFIELEFHALAREI